MTPDEPAASPDTQPTHIGNMWNAPSTPIPKPTHKRSHWLPWLVTVLLLIAAGAMVYYALTLKR